MYGLIFLSYFGFIAGFIFLTVCIACGLYYLSEFIEEYAEFSKRILKRLIYIVIFLHLILFIVDGFPFFSTLFSILLHIIYFINLRSFPCISVSSYQFITAIIFTVLNNLLWIWHFRSYFGLLLTYSSVYVHKKDTKDYTLGQIASFFAICIWLIPFSLFVSLPAGDNILPISSNDYLSSGSSINYMRSDKYKRIGMIKSIFSKIKISMEIIMQNINWNNRSQKNPCYI
ncbi:hypothetical protein PNEG_02655 [Pneumocystis murina B123]|uniref:Protein SVP26 n=1 Tax=Pneumocystis murina (strain B123) TaxID=1069680 RepID=M7P4V8_PNEMU|nr:hypothetical protein PNEG_02655 [Pneumocystis murina B123]EMR08870.1 hypothetical protein PNEG_02655 [Pneumocystis murina B123]